MGWSTPKKSVLVPFDFSDASKEALRTALDLVEKPADIDVVYVMTPPSPPSPGVVWGEIDVETMRERARETLADELKSLGAAGATPHVLVGSAAKRLVDFARERASELVIIPSHGRTGVERWIMGSVAERVVRLAPCPVLVLRRESE
jgi:nucleotide-binding universal stress UspA family protein